MPRTGKGPTDQSASAFLKACRETLELSQKELAPLVGVSQQQISKYERGESSVPREVLKKVGELAGIRLEEFGQPEFSVAAEPGGFEAARQASYTAESSPEAADGFDTWQDDEMFLDLRKLHDPTDRKNLSAQYMKMLRRQKKI